MSHEISPGVGEYARMSTTAGNAALGPLAGRYLSSLERRLQQAGMKAPVLMMTCAGGVLPTAVLAERPAYALFSGPAGGVMGSRATGDSRVMKIIFKELKKRGLYYLDSYVSGDSVCQVIADDIGIPFIKRDVFLDNQSDTQYIRKQLSELKDLARASGSAVGIGHDRKNTLLVLKEEVHKLEDEGFELVFLSDLTR